MKIKAKISKRIRFYTMMIACCAFLWMMVENNWINLDTLTSYAFLVVIVVIIMVAFAAGFAFLIRLLINIKERRESDERNQDRENDDIT